MSKPSEILTREEPKSFTPGPWSWDGIPPRFYGDGDWENVAPWLNADSTDDAVLTGEICCPNRANLRLIAAAPELYGALKAAMERIETLRDPSINGPWNDALKRKIDAALAKATGDAK